jgi:hypothetical protein
MRPSLSATGSNRPRFPRAAVVAAFALALLLPAQATAQGSGNGFLFGEPAGSFGVRAGFAQAAAGSDIFSFVTDELTLGRGDFATVSFDADLAFRIHRRVDLVFGGSYTGSSARSEFRHFVDNNDLPIEQTTRLARLPLTASAKVYLASRGRSVGRFAWIPASFTPFVGAGGGAMWYRFKQDGDFINMETFDVFGDTFQSSGWAPTAIGFAGLDISLTPRLALTGEGRYTWARASMSSDFSGFEKIDLSGYNASLGLYVRF